MGSSRFRESCLSLARSTMGKILFWGSGFSPTDLSENLCTVKVAKDQGQMTLRQSQPGSEGPEVAKERVLQRRTAPSAPAPPAAAASPPPFPFLFLSSGSLAPPRGSSLLLGQWSQGPGAQQLMGTGFQA